MNIKDLVDSIVEGIKKDSKSESFTREVDRLFSMGLSDEAALDKVTKEALVRADIDTTQWDGVSAQLLCASLYEEAARNRGYVYNGSSHYGDFYSLIKDHVKAGVYSPVLTEKYTEAEIHAVGSMLIEDRDKEFTFVGLKMIAGRYLASAKNGDIWELPQERFLVIGMWLMQNEPVDKRMGYIAEVYWLLSNLYATVATPTLANSGKPNAQLSSCFIDTVGDSIDEIYLDNWDTARVSKNGGGVGIYMGKVRGRNASIQGYENRASGTIPWVRNLNNTAISVDQLGVRTGAIAIYQEAFHWDILEFLQIGTNNGDERFKARDVWPGICVPDYFMELIEAGEDGRMLNPDAPWYLFDPHEVKTTMGWTDAEGRSLGLEDFYDEQEGGGTWRNKYQECINHPTLRRKEITVSELVKAILVAQLETGAPYMFYRDEVNRANPNKHKGMIYSSNLCTEIMQNQSVTELVSETTVTEEGDEYIIYKRKIGDFVVCNLASLNLGRVVPAGVLQRAIRILMRMLDNVIEVNNLPLKQAHSTNQKYRAVGLGTFGWHHVLAMMAIDWNSEESVEFADKLYEEIAFYAITESSRLGKEKGNYKAFKGSEYNTGEYFTRRGYSTATSRFDWDALAEEVKEYMRNGWWGAVAPNASTGLIAASTQGIDPFYGREGIYYEEKKDLKYAVLAPGINTDNFYLYYGKNAHKVDRDITIRQNEARQRHVDQGVSFNIYVEKGIAAKDLLELHRKAWRAKFKSTYYVRAQANEVEEADCEACQ